MPSEPEIASPGPEVLVVEDDADAAAAMAMTLRRRGCRVREAHSLAEAQAMLEPPPAWVVLDLTLPDGDGLTLLRQVYDRVMPTRIAVVTATTDPERIWEATRLRAEMVLRKPVEPAEVVKRIA